MLHSAIRSKAVAIMRSNPLIITGLYLTICKVCASGIQAWYRRCILRVLSRQQKIEAANRRLEDAATMFQKLVRGVQARELALEMVRMLFQNVWPYALYNHLFFSVP